MGIFPLTAIRGVIFCFPAETNSAGQVLIGAQRQFIGRLHSQRHEHVLQKSSVTDLTKHV